MKDERRQYHRTFAHAHPPRERTPTLNPLKNTTSTTKPTVEPAKRPTGPPHHTSIAYPKHLSPRNGQDGQSP